MKTKAREIKSSLSPLILNQKNILLKIKDIKPKYEKEGLVLLGIFGSYANNTANKDSDIDILYDVKSNHFSKKYPGFKAFTRLNEIKRELKEVFNTKVDLATIDNHSETFKKFALKDAIYVT